MQLPAGHARATNHARLLASPLIEDAIHANRCSAAGLHIEKRLVLSGSNADEDSLLVVQATMWMMGRHWQESRREEALGW